MGCRVHRMFCPRLVNILFLGVVITTLHITWRLYYLGTTVKPICRVKETDIRDFSKQWCRMQSWRVDWETMAKPCKGQVAWKQRQVDSERRTDAKRSFIKRWEILPAGQFSRFYIQSVTKNGVLKTSGGDAWRVYIRQGPASLAPQVWDHNNGMYEVVFLVMEPGTYTAQITLDFTLCDGLREPPVDWFIKGTIQGKYQPDGILGYIGDDYILESLGGQSTFRFSVPQNGDLITDVSLTHSSLASTATECGVSCNLLQNGFGRWVSGVWQPYVHGSNSAIVEGKITPADTLWIYGDSVSQRFLASLQSRRICKKHFEKCTSSYMWIYELTSEQEAKTKFKPNDFNETIVLQHMTEILDSTDMKTHNSVFLFNLGVHFSISLNFTTYRHLIDNIVKLLKRKTIEKNENTAIPIWKTTTSIEKESVHKMYAELPRNITHWRFHTHQRLELFHKYAVSAMCKAGIPVLDVYPMTASYPNGTLDHVHYSNNVQRAAEDQLIRFIADEMEKRKRGNVKRS